MRDGDDRRLSSVGVARFATRVEVVDDDDRVLPPGEVGEVVVSGPTVMAGYLDLPGETADSIRNRPVTATVVSDGESVLAVSPATKAGGDGSRAASVDPRQASAPSGRRTDGFTRVPGEPQRVRFRPHH